MNIIINETQYQRLAEDEQSFSYLDKDGETGNYKETPGSEVSSVGREGDRYGKHNPHSDTIAKMLAPQAWFLNTGIKTNRLRNNITEANEEIDNQLMERINFIIEAINGKVRDGHLKAKVLYHILENVDRRNISGDDKNKLRDLIMR